MRKKKNVCLDPTPSCVVGTGGTVVDLTVVEVNQMCQLPLFFTWIPRQHHVFVALAWDIIHTDCKKRLDEATYCFRTQVFEAIGAKLVGSNLLLIGGI